MIMSLCAHIAGGTKEAKDILALRLSALGFGTLTSVFPYSFANDSRLISDLFVRHT